MEAPRPILGSTGSRVRLIFNYMGSQYLLLLDWDDGDSKRQERIGDGIPESLVSRLESCTEVHAEVWGASEWSRRREDSRAAQCHCKAHQRRERGAGH